MDRLVSVVIVCWNSAPFLPRCLAGIAEQTWKETELIVVDNASADESLSHVPASATIIRNETNLGFARAANQGIAAAHGDFVLLVNPDAYLTPHYIETVLAVFDDTCGAATGTLMRARGHDIEPAGGIDSLGIRMTRSGRHFDIEDASVIPASHAVDTVTRPSPGLRPPSPRSRGARGNKATSSPSPRLRGEGARRADEGRVIRSDPERSEGESRDPLRHSQGVPRLAPHARDDTYTEIFGVSGAAAMYSMAFIRDVSVFGEFFDEDFFAYREDADVAWRGRLMGWRARYVPDAIAYHVRTVTPERRRELSPSINMHSVKNRFLLRMKNEGAFLALRNAPFELARDLVTIGAVLTIERSSLPALSWLWRNRKRIWAKRREIQRRRRVSDRELARWFR
jgi:GT2 family glycosyltransferase